MGHWTEGEVLGLDFETTGIDRFTDVPVSYALVSVVNGAAVRSWSGLIDPGCDIPAEATHVHGITTARARREGMPLAEAVGLVSDAVIAAGRRGVPLAGMRLDYDLTILDVQATHAAVRSLSERGWRGPVLDVAVLDRHLDATRQGRRTLCDLCGHYGVEFERAHDAWADALASVQVLFAMAGRFGDLGEADLRALHEGQVRWHREWTEGQEAWRLMQGKAPLDPREYEWPLARAVLPPAA